MPVIEMEGKLKCSRLERLERISEIGDEINMNEERGRDSFGDQMCKLKERESSM